MNIYSHLQETIRYIKKHLILFFVLSITACIPASANRPTIVKPETGVTIPSHVKRIAVLEFSDHRPEKSKRKYSTPAKILQEKIITGLFLKPEISVIERTDLDKIVKEQKRILSGIIDESTAVEVGKLAGVDAVLMGSIKDYGKVILPVAKLVVQLRLVGVKTGKVLFALEVDARKKNVAFPFELLNEIIEEAASQVLHAIR